MKKLLATLGLYIFLAPTVPSALAYSSWNLPQVNQDITITESGKIQVTETIKADFTQDPHRGIFRYIPISYTDKFGNPFNLRFKLISVTDENGTPQPLAENGKDWGDYYIKIGDANVLRSDMATYVIKYEVDRAMGYFEDHDELYWNPYTRFEIPVLSSTVTVHLPKSADTSNMRAACYTGSYGSIEEQCTAQVIDDKTFQYKTTAVSYAGDGFTIVAGWPTGIIAKPSIFARIWWFIFDNWALLIPIIAFAFLYWRWNKTGRDPRAENDTIIPRYKAPEGLSPTQVGTIIDEKVDMHDITSVIITYAVKGYLKINELKTKKMLFFEDTDYELEILKDYSKAEGIQSHEKKILDAIFEDKKIIKISDLKFKFYKHIESIKNEIYDNLIKGKYFVNNPEKVRGVYLGIGIAMIVITIFFAAAVFALLGLTAIFAIIVTGILFIIFGRIMPRKTLKGANAYMEIKGLEEYIRTAEKDRIKFQEDQNIFFEKLLPYAMVLGLGEKWAGAFKDLYKKPPSWFSGNNMDSFNTYYLVNRLSNFSTQAQTAFASSPRSSGSGGSSAWSGGSGFSGGFSGGGFGGGGGGGW